MLLGRIFLVFYFFINNLNNSSYEKTIIKCENDGNFIIGIFQSFFIFSQDFNFTITDANMTVQVGADVCSLLWIQDY